MTRIGALLMTTIVTACGAPSSSQQHGPADAAIDSHQNPPGDPCGCSALPGPRCGTTCGNGTVDVCYVNSPMGCHCALPSMEVCDDALGGPSCAQMGYFGGTSACTSCQPDASNCNPCGPDAVACGTFADWGFYNAAGSGSHVALASLDALKLFDGITAGTTIALTDVGGVAGVPNGFLVAQGTTLTPVSYAGVLGTTVGIDGEWPVMVYGPAGQVGSAWTEVVSQTEWRVWFEIVDATGVVVSTPTELFANDGTQPGLATDGTHYFVGGHGSLATIASDGTVAATTTGFPATEGGSGPEDVHVTWGGTSGWYVMGVSFSYVAQRFDATGARVGGVIAIGDASDAIADGDDLLVLRRTNNAIDLVRYDPTGAVTATAHVGAGTYAGRILPTGALLTAVWHGPTHLQIAQVAAP